MVSGISAPSASQHRVGVHVVADVAHQHQAAARQRDACRRPARVECGPACSRRVTGWPPFSKLRPACRSSGRASCDRRRPCRRRRPRRRCPRKSMDSGDGGFQHHIGDAGRVGRGRSGARGRSRARCAGHCWRSRIASGASGVAAIAGELRRRRQRRSRRRPVSRPARRRRPRRRPRRHGCRGQRHGLVEEASRAGDHRGAAHRVVAAAARRRSSSGMASVP